MNKYKAFLDTVAKFAGKTGAYYHSYYDRENAKSREAAKAQQSYEKKQAIQQALNNAVDNYYGIYADLLAEAINNVYQAVNISPIRNVKQLAATPPAYQDRQGVIHLIYKIYIKPGDGVTADKVQRIVEQEMNILAGLYGMRLVKVSVTMLPQRYSPITIAFWDDVMGAITV